MHVDDAAVDAALSDTDLVGTLRRAFIDFADGRAAMQPRVRTDCDGVRLSTLGAVWSAQGVAGAKVYTTIGGRFNFLIVLFSTHTGSVLATFDANAITRWRTAAISLLAAQRFARAGAATLALFGTGVQARAHLEAFADHYALRSVRIVSRGDASEFASEARQIARCDVRVTSPQDALRDADLVITATRAREPLFDGRWVAPGAFIAAVGSSKPDARELDDALIARASAVVVEWREQTLREAGDLVLTNPKVLAKAPLIELGVALRDRELASRMGGDVVIFKSVGVGLADVATADLVFRRLQLPAISAA